MLGIGCGAAACTEQASYRGICEDITTHQRVDDRNCPASGQGSNGGQFVWVYYRSGETAPPVGSRIKGGVTTPPEGTEVSRGGVSNRGGSISGDEGNGGGDEGGEEGGGGGSEGGGGE
jgi:hypothetical protein